MYSTNIDEDKSNNSTLKNNTPQIYDKEMRGSQTQKKFMQSLLSFSINLVIFWMVMIVIAWGTFLIFFTSPDTVVVPDLVGKDVVEAILELQKKGLNIEVSEQVSGLLKDRGKVLDQDPKQGINIRQKRKVKLIVSKGAVVNNVPTFVGANLNTIYDNYDNTFDGLGEYFDIKSVSKIFDKTPPGTILAQDPSPNEKLYLEFTDVKLVVSRGDKVAVNVFPDLLGLSFDEAFSIIEAYSPKFNFYFFKNEDREYEHILDNKQDNNVLYAGTIMEHIPSAGEEINSETPLYIGLQETAIAEQPDVDLLQYYTVGIFTVSLTEYELAHEIIIYRNYDSSFVSADEVEQKKPIVQIPEEKVEYLKFVSVGGTLTIPYLVVPGVKFSIHRFGNEVWSYTVSRK